MMIRYALAVLAATLCLSGCGFHVRGTQDLGPVLQGQSIYLDTGGAPQLAPQLAIQLQRYRANVTGAPAQADVIVSIARERFDTRVLSVDPDTGKAREYEIGYQADLNVRRGDGTPLLSRETVEVVRDYTFDETAVLGKFGEEYIIRGEIVKDVADTVIRRLQTLGPAS